ncbi:DEAD-box helicase Dbp80-like [Bradysia coprophila]|uniref:DEAD-box helicase Dbp80-like n=1 Tax=Bradysia coprophila TaxID=38358 RepID=UPI00187DA126|nr:DEAD-box helicase Dbp80-like [Bradysia coprophila]
MDNIVDSKVEKVDSPEEDKLTEFYRKVRKYGCYECAFDPDHSLIHDCFVVGLGLMSWIAEQDALHYPSSSPMYSEESFEGLHLKSIVLDTLYERRVNKPTKIQGIALPAMLADPPRDVLVQGPSGAGKTIALVIAMLNRIDEKKNGTQILCLVPTLLAAQRLSRTIALYLSHANFYAILTGGEIESNHGNHVESIAAHVAVGTVESMLDWLDKLSIDLANISMLMIDDADYLMKSEECWADCKKLAKLLPTTCQMVLCSTTFDQSSIELASDMMKAPDIILSSPTSQCLKTVKQYYIESTSKEDKYHAIGKLYDCLLRKRDDGKTNRNKVIIFCNERETAEWLYKMMETDDRYFVTDHRYNVQYFKVSLVTEDLKYETDCNHLLIGMDGGSKYTKLLGPFNELNAFCCSNNTNVLITTDILSRAIETYNHDRCTVVNFELAVNQFGEADFETYVHRIGRTGRFDNEGRAISLVDSEQSRRVCTAIEEYFGKEIHPLDVNDPNEINLKLCS